MNILIIPAFFQTKHRPTLGSFFLDQAVALHRAGHTVTILYCDTYSVKCVAEWAGYDEEESDQIEGVSVFRKKSFCPLKHGMEGHREAFTKGICELHRRYMAEQSIDIIHAHCCVWAGYAAMRLSEKIRVPYVVTEHATLFELHKNDITPENNKVIREVFQRAKKTICVSRAFAKLIEEYTSNIEIIGNVVDCDRFCIPDTSVKKKELSFFTVCYMEDEKQLYKKGIDILFKAWARVIEKVLDVQLIVGGGGKAVEKAQVWTKQQGIEKSVTFLGALGREQVKEQMQRCDCFVLPSRYETFGVVYIEAMACGKPVIAAANGGPDDFVKDFNGCLIQPENIEELAEAILQIIDRLHFQEETHTYYDADQIASFVREQFSYEAIAEKLERVFTSE